MFLSSLCVLQFVAKIKNKVDRKTVVMSNKDAPLGFLPDSEPDLAKKKLHTIKHMGGRKKKKHFPTPNHRMLIRMLIFFFAKSKDWLWEQKHPPLTQTDRDLGHEYSLYSSHKSLAPFGKRRHIHSLWMGKKTLCPSTGETVEHPLAVLPFNFPGSST